MNIDIGLLFLTAASIGFIHTLLGPDHYLPFVAMSAARGWTQRRTLWITALCGMGHVLGSVVIGLVGIGVGVSLSHLQWLEGIRGDVAAWLLAGFGLAYMVWGLKKAWRSRPHTHEHVHEDGTLHRHEHGHEGRHLHPHVDPAKVKSITPWALFVIFVLGPCEPLIPLVMYPASQHSAWGLAVVVLAFGAVTVATMLTVVWLALKGIQHLPLESAERYSHALAGAALCACGLGIVFLGL
ncbi:MAG: sulfite exporter TauE/SafE family protein [Steroidobacteraceae bacterium]|nr:sulfite exporter TauE/SafE family protein [Steroidobacteraceae bacterium]